MDIFDITILKTDDNQLSDTKQSMYNLIEPTFTTKDLVKFTTIVTREQEMRIDLVSYALYQSVNYVDLLLNINDIDNPLNIKEGDTLLYPPLEHLQYYRITPDTTTVNRRRLLSPNKSSKKDPNRQQYIENNYQLPPTFLDTPSNPVSTSAGKITISNVR